MKIHLLFTAALLAAGPSGLTTGCAQVPNPSPKADQPIQQLHSTVAPGATVVALPALVSQTRIDVRKDCGAKGDGKTNDTAAFQKAAQLLQEKNGGTLIIPKGIYIVGLQTHEAGKYPYYQTQPIFAVKDLQGLRVEGNGSTLRLAPGMRFGSFDKETGEPYKPPQMPFVDADYRVDIGSMIDVRNSRNIVIRNLELDGNSGNIQLGGEWGDTNWQVRSYGLLLADNHDVHLDRVHAHHHALDGILIDAAYKEGDPPTPHMLTDCTFEYNARQGMSWTGGRGVRAFRSRFNHTGRAKVKDVVLASMPGAGLDIEAEGSICRDGYFEDCEFINNWGAGFVADSGDGGYSKFKRCTFWGTTNWSAWSNKPGLKYEDCNFYGSAVHSVGSPDPALATSWTRCHFEDKPWTDGQVYRQNTGQSLLDLNGKMENVRFDDCTFVANTCRSIWIHADPAAKVAMNGCTITHKKADLPQGEFQGLFRYVTFRNTRFKEEFPEDTEKLWYINSELATVEEGVFVEGPRVKWMNWKIGWIGAIEPTTPAQ